MISLNGLSSEGVIMRAKFVSRLRLTTCLVLAVGLYSCAAPLQVPPELVEGSYTAALLACVKDYSTKAEVDLCRQGVDERFGVDNVSN